jgi:hypothetical protein
MNETTNQEQTTASVPKRPVFLSILCILSFIGNGFWAVVSLVCIAAPEWTIRTVFHILKEQEGPKTEELLDPMQAEMVKQIEESLLANAIDFYKPYVIIGSAVSLVLALVAIIGVARMWRLRKAGFWFYTTANVLFMAGMIYVQNWTAVVLALLFIVLYSVNLKHLK